MRVCAQKQCHVGSDDHVAELTEDEAYDRQRMSLGSQCHVRRHNRLCWSLAWN